MQISPEIPKWLLDIGAGGATVGLGLFVANQVVTLVNRLRPKDNGPGSPKTCKDEILAREAIHRIDGRTDDMAKCLEKLTFIQEQVVDLLKDRR
jgi:hypothetical protein